MKFVESYTLQELNMLKDEGEEILTESRAAQLDLKGVEAVFPLIKAMPSDTITKNYRMYTRAAFLDKGTPEQPRGYESWVAPYPKPVIREHKLNTDPIMGIEGDTPMGRIIYSSWKKRKANEARTPREGTNVTWQGTGDFTVIAAITDQESIKKVLNGQYYSVSVGTKPYQVIESISGIDIMAAARGEVTAPNYIRGQEYDGRLSYWTIKEMEGLELSFVNFPAQPEAHVLTKDLGAAQIQTLLGESHNGEFKFYDALTKEHIDISTEHFAFDESFNLTDSYRPTNKYWFMNMDIHNKATELDRLQKRYCESFEDDLANKDDWTIQDFARAETALEALNSSPTPETSDLDTPQAKTLEDLIDEVLN